MTQRLLYDEGCRYLRSAMTNSLVVPTTRCSTIGDRSFAATAPRIWNSLPSRVTSSSSLTTFKRQLKTELLLVLCRRHFIFCHLIVQWSGSLETLCHFSNICMYVCMYVCIVVTIQRHEWLTQRLLLACAKSHMLSASRRQPHLLHVSAVDRRQTWSMDKS